MEQPERSPKLAVVAIVSLLLNSIIVFLVLLFVLKFIGPKNTTEDWLLDSVEVSQEFKPGQPATLNVETVTIYIPPFALPLPGSIFMSTSPTSSYLNNSEPEWNRPQVVDVQFRSATGDQIPEIILSAPIKVCFQLTQKQWQDFIEYPETYAIQFYASRNDTPGWLSMPMTTHPDLLQLCGRTDQLSLFALSVQSDLSIPVTGPSATPGPLDTPDPTATQTKPSPADLGNNLNRGGSDSVLQLTITLLPTNTLFPTATKISTLPPTATATGTPRPTVTPPPTSTRTPRPTATPPPTSTRTPRPTATPPPTSTRTPRPTATPPPTATRTLRPTATLLPTATRTPFPTATPPPTATRTLRPTATNLPTSTTRPPTATLPPPTATQPPPTASPRPPTATLPPATATNPPPTATNEPPTPIPPTNPPPPTDPPPTDPPPPTAEPTQPPADTPTP